MSEIKITIESFTSIETALSRRKVSSAKRTTKIIYGCIDIIVMETDSRAELVWA